ALVVQHRRLGYRTRHGQRRCQQRRLLAQDNVSALPARSGCRGRCASSPGRHRRQVNLRRCGPLEEEGGAETSSMARAGAMEAEALGAAQADVVAFLSDPASYPRVKQVDRVETHGNLVFLAGEEAWKIKRAVEFSYMDFSTLAKRRSACSREVEINRRFGSPLYLGCVPITRSRTGRLAFGGDGA